ncbi:MAG: hypothetical protein NZ951_06735 [Dehalococcoidia bacterium]|nr:hypothetical protein [Dehalococcoidia bacterium]MDW8120551.1 hypothetical protein [Chloroflexota bacterium]
MRETQSAPAGAIDSLGLGFALVARRPYLVLLPVGVAAALMLLPAWTAPTQTRQVLSVVEDVLLTRAPTPDHVLGIFTQADTLGRGLSQANILRLIVWQLPMLNIPASGASVLWGGGLPLLVGFMGGLALAGLLLASCYLAPLGQAVVGRPRPLAPAILKGWLALVGYRLLLGTLAVVGLLGGGLLVAVALLLSPFVAALLGGLIIGGAFLVLFYLFLVEEAIFIDGLGPAQAMLRSAQVVFGHFWACVRFWLLTAIISLGARLLLERFTETLPGALAASAVYAFIATGITAAGMVFYRERASRLPVRA